MIFHALDTKDDAKSHRHQLMSEMIANRDYLEEGRSRLKMPGLFDHDEALAVKGTQLV